MHPKYVIFVAPFCLLLVAEGYVLLERRALRNGVAAVSLAVFAVAFARFWQPQAYGRREDWRGVARLLAREVRDDDVLLLVRNRYALLRYYWPDAGRQRRVFYARWDTIKNDFDPLDLVQHSLSRLGADERRVRFNPRLCVESWRVP